MAWGLSRVVARGSRTEPPESILNGIPLPLPMTVTFWPAASGPVPARTGAGVKRGVAGRSIRTIA